ncbi:Uncharacterised protein [Segatella copri]|nr:Uncharacterised protein [Segatella copri]
MTAEKILLPTCKDMVEIWEHAVDFVGVGIPPGKQSHLGNDAHHLGDAARYHAVYCPKSDGHDEHSQSSPKHSFRVYEFGIGKEHGDNGDCHISQHDPFQCHQSLLRVLVYLEIIFYHASY